MLRRFVTALGLVFGFATNAAAQLSPPSPAPSPGGLAPPPAMESETPAEPPPGTATEAKLEEAEREDAGRGLEFFWLNGEIGAEHLGLRSFSDSDLVDAAAVGTSNTGLLYGGGLGFRLVFITGGARFRMAQFSEFKLWTLNLEAGLRVPMGSLEPYATLGGGYASSASLKALGDAGPDIDVRGFDVRGGVGIDYYLTELFSAGVNLTGDVLFLSRSKIDTAALPAESAAIYGKDGSSIGGGVSLTALIGLHL
jgi:hypothetical protein